MNFVPDEERQNAAPDAASEPHRNSVFFGRFGLRAGWGIAIFLVIWFVFAFIGQNFGLAATGQLHDLMAARMQAQTHPNAPRPHFQVKFEPALVSITDGVMFAAILGLCWFFARGERRPFNSYGIGSNRWKDFFPGAFWGLAAMSLLVAVMRARHVLVFDYRALFGAAAIGYGIKWLLAFLLVGFAEEYAFRGYIQYTLMRGVWGFAEKLAPNNPRAVAFWLAATFWSAVFLLAHIGNSGENKFGLLAVFLAGLLFSYALWRTGSLWFGIGMHMSWDWAQSFLFGVADSGNISVGRLYVTHPAGNPLYSGGPDGPEGSLYVLGALLLLFVVLRLTRPGTQPALKQGPRLPPTHHEIAPAIS